MNKKTIIRIILAIVVIIAVKKGVSFVYDKILVMNAPTMQEISESNPWTVPTDWFQTDTITIKGRIEDYDAEQFGFTSMACYYTDVFEKGSTVLVLDIADDGTFCKKFLASYPVHNSFIADGSKVRFNANADVFYCLASLINDVTFDLRLCLPCHCDEGEQNSDDGFLVHVRLCLYLLLYIRCNRGNMTLRGVKLS